MKKTTMFGRVCFGSAGGLSIAETGKAMREARMAPASLCPIAHYPFIFAAGHGTGVSRQHDPHVDCSNPWIAAFFSICDDSCQWAVADGCRLPVSPAFAQISELHVGARCARPL